MTDLHRYDPLPLIEFVVKVARRSALAFLVLVLSLVGGMAGYVHFEHLSWIDAFLNSAMLLGGMGPVNTPQTVGGKLFAGFFALYAGLVFVAIVAIVLTPFLTRIMRHLRRREEQHNSANNRT